MTPVIIGFQILSSNVSAKKVPLMYPCWHFGKFFNCFEFIVLLDEFIKIDEILDCNSGEVWNWPFFQVEHFVLQYFLSISCVLVLWGISFQLRCLSEQFSTYQLNWFSKQSNLFRQMIWPIVAKTIVCNYCRNIYLLKSVFLISWATCSGLLSQIEFESRF